MAPSIDITSITAPRILGICNIALILIWVIPSFLAGVIGIIIAAAINTAQAKDTLKFVIPLIIDGVVTCISIMWALSVAFFRRRSLAIVNIVSQMADLLMKCAIMIYFGVCYATQFADRNILILVMSIVGVIIILRLILCGFSFWFVREEPPKRDFANLHSI